MRATELYNRVYGYLAGAAIGDASGKRTENMHYKDIEAQYGRITHFGELPPKNTNSEQPPLELFYKFGVIHAGDPVDAARDGYVMAVAAALSAGATMESVVESCRAHGDTFSDANDFMVASEFIGRLDWMVKLANDAADVFALLRQSRW